MQGNVVKAAVWLGASMVLASVVLVVGLYVVVSSQAQRMEQALIKARGPETTIKFSGLDQAFKGVRLPSSRSIIGDVPYFPKTPDFKWADTSNVTRAARLKAMSEDSEAARDTPGEVNRSKRVTKPLADTEAGSQETLSDGVECLLTEAENLRITADEWRRFWFLDDASKLTPFRTHSGLGP